MSGPVIGAVSSPLAGLRAAALAAAALTAVPSALVAGIGPVPAALALLLCGVAVVAPRSPAGVVGPALLVVVLATGAAGSSLGGAAALLVAGTATLWCTSQLLTALAAAGQPGTVEPSTSGAGLVRSVVRCTWRPLLPAVPAALLCLALEAWARGASGPGTPAAVGVLALAALVAVVVGGRRAARRRP